MPQASNELRRWAMDKFGSIDSGPVVEWLEAQGFELLPTFEWLQVGSALTRLLTNDELQAFQFLMDEWDFNFPEFV